MRRPKNHHYIPQMLLKRFTNHEGKLYVYDKSHRDKGIQKKDPKKTFVRRHFYTQVEDDGTRDASVETEFLSRLENDVSPVIEKIVSAARRGSSPNLSPAERDIWIKFYYLLFARVPDRLENAAEEVRQIVHARIASASQSRLLNDLELSVQNDPETMDRHLKNGSIQNLQMSPSGEVYEFLSKCRFVIAAIRKPKSGRNFVIGSNPIVSLSDLEVPYIVDPHAEVWFSLARDVAVSFCPGEGDQIISATKRHIESINWSVFNKSTVIAGCSSELIESLLDEESRINRAPAEK